LLDEDTFAEEETLLEDEIFDTLALVDVARF
jgi:hypothetical protein